MLLRLSHLLTSTCFILQHDHLWERFLKTSCDRLLYGLFLLIQNWHASMKMAMASLLFVAVITLVKPYQAMFQRFYSHYNPPGS